jgi:hypothetical protein
VLGQGLVLRFGQQVEPLIMKSVSPICQDFNASVNKFPWL